MYHSTIMSRLKALKEMEKRSKIVLILVLVLEFMVSGLLVGMFHMILSGDAFRQGASPGGLFTRGILCWSGLRFTVLVFLITGFITLLFAGRNLMLNHIETIGKHGERITGKGTLGRQKMMTITEAKDYFDVSEDMNDHFEFIFGYAENSAEGHGPVKVSRRFSDMEKNKTVLVLGRPGTGKSYSLIRPEIMQALRRRASIVVFDPKGELYASMSNVCRQMGWDVKVLNCIESEYSNAWNVLMEVFDHDTEMLDSDRLFKFADIYITNMFPGQNPDFWKDGAKSVLAALVGLYAYRREQFIIKTLLRSVKEIYRKVNGTGIWDALPEYYRNEHECTVADAKKLFRAVCKDHHFRPEDVDNIIQKTEHDAPEVSLSVVLYDVLIMGEGRMDDIRKEINAIPRYHVAWSAFRTFDMGMVEDRVKGSTLQTLGQSLRIFGSEKRRRMLSNNDINLWETSSKECAYFVMADDTDSVRPVLSLFFNFLFEDCQFIWDKTEAECKRRDINPLDILHPVSVIMDEAASMGTILGFPTFLSKARSRHIDVTMAFQNIAQMEERYGEFGTDQLIGNTEYIVYLGCNDIPSAEMISKYCGDTTVVSQSWKEDAGVIAGPVRQITLSETKVELMPITEAFAYGGSLKDKLLVIKTGVKPLELSKFPYTDHPMAKGLRKVTVYSTVRPLKKRFPDEYFRIKDREERNAEETEDNATKQMNIINGVLDILEKVNIDYGDISAYEDLEDISSFEDAEFVMTVEDTGPGEQKNGENQKMRGTKDGQEEKKKRPKTPRQPKNDLRKSDTVGSDYRSRFGKKFGMEREGSGDKEGHASELEDL